MMLYALYLALGAVAGFSAGLFGIGGGLVVVPALIFAFTVHGMPSDILAHMALGTSLATIVVTSISSLWTHQKRGGIDWPTFRQMTVGIVVGSVLGVYVAVQLTGPILQILLALFVFTMSVKMWLGMKPKEGGSHSSTPVIVIAGAIIGGVSSLFGIGGGSLSVPFLSYYSLPMKKAVGTSAACGLPIALVGASTNVVLGLDVANLPQYATGFVYWPAFIGIACTSTIFARLGANAAHNLPSDKLQRGFAAFLVVVGVQLMWQALS